MGIFGWDLPPGCTSGDIERHFGGGNPSPESEELYQLLEDAGCSQEVIDKAVRMYDALEDKVNNPCPTCERLAMEAEIAESNIWKLNTQTGRI